MLEFGEDGAAGAASGEPPGYEDYSDGDPASPERFGPAEREETVIRAPQVTLGTRTGTPSRHGRTSWGHGMGSGGPVGAVRSSAPSSRPRSLTPVPPRCVPQEPSLKGDKGEPAVVEPVSRGGHGPPGDTWSPAVGHLGVVACRTGRGDAPCSLLSLLGSAIRGAAGTPGPCGKEQGGCCCGGGACRSPSINAPPCPPQGETGPLGPPGLPGLPGDPGEQVRSRWGGGSCPAMGPAVGPQAFRLRAGACGVMELQALT